jgi:alginate O-acetyltransferase complex protein AlgI
MIFTSEIFILFAIIFFPAYFMMPTARAQNILALVASWVFYGWWDWRFLGLIGASTLVNFALASTPKRAKRWLWLAITCNLGLLGVFKYFGFFTAEFARLLAGLGVTTDLPILTLLLPVGISFFTFQALSYVIDVARGTLPPERDLIRFATYIALWPQLVAGPIVRAQQLLPQLARHQPFRWPNVWLGAEMIVIGAVLKLVVADRLAPLVDRVFAQPDLFSQSALSTGVVFFAFQIYADFAGYSLMAIGFGRLMGLRFPINFRRPYLARNFSEFWRRWHISLSDWLRDYLYIPLGGNRVRPGRNLMATMVLGGLWHGAAWPFVIWGGLHGGYLIIAQRLFWPKMGKWPARLCVFLAVCFAWIFFRADSFGQATLLLSGLIGSGTNGGMGLPQLEVAIGASVIAILTVVEILREDSRFAQSVMRARSWRLLSGVALILSLPLLGQFDGGAFVYFQF